MKKFIPQNFNDMLCLLGLATITTMWILQGKDVITMPNEIIGATIVTWSLIFNFYFRKSPPQEG